ncbi:MAG: DUF302 domain-containing protein [Acidiferrobacterales bacterium]|nr:DUF302 domain-containing protein [Acidiferrobacterales bacterium]
MNNKNTLVSILISSFLAVFSASSAAEQSPDGITAQESNADVATTVERLTTALEAKGMKVFAVVDHAAGAQSVDAELRPTTVVIFGNPKVGTGMMKCAQSVGIDLPMKALIWEAEDGKVWLGYNAPDYLAKRHGMKGCDGLLEKVSGALANFAKAATTG